jgi:hypothetical protein
MKPLLIILILVELLIACFLLAPECVYRTQERVAFAVWLQKKTPEARLNSRGSVASAIGIAWGFLLWPSASWLSRRCSLSKRVSVGMLPQLEGHLVRSPNNCVERMGTSVQVTYNLCVSGGWSPPLTHVVGQ